MRFNPFMNDFSLYIMVKIGKVYLLVLAVFTYVCCIDSVMVVHNVVFLVALVS